jgi:hypothetical protein
MSGPEDDAEVLICTLHPERAAVAGCIECGCLVCDACRQVGDDGLSRCTDCAQPATDALLAVEPLAVEPQPVEPQLAEPQPVEFPTPDADAPTAEPRPTLRVAPSHADAPLPSWAQPPPPPPEPEVVTPSAPQAGMPSAVVSWEGSEPNDLRAWMRTVGEALSSPVRFPLAVPWVRGDYIGPLTYALLCVSIGYLLGVVTGVFGWDQLPPGLRMLIGEPAPMSPTVYHLLMLPMIPLSTTIRLVVLAGASHLLLRLFGAARLPFEATFRAYCYAQTGKLLLAVPIMGPFADSIYAVFLLLGGLRVAHRTNFATGLLAMMPMIFLSGQAL